MGLTRGSCPPMQSDPLPSDPPGALSHPELGVCSLGSRALPAQSPECLSCGRCPLSYRPGLQTCPAPPALCTSPGPWPHCPLGFPNAPAAPEQGPFPPGTFPPGQLQASQLCQASRPLQAFWGAGTGQTPPPTASQARVPGSGCLLGPSGGILGGQSPHCRHRRVYLHTCGHVGVRGGWHGRLARCPRLIVGFGSGGGGGAGVTAEALTD